MSKRELRCIYEIVEAPYGKVICTLKEFVDKNKISRKSLAKMSGIGYGVINRYYNNEVIRYDSVVLSKFFFCMKCDIEYLIQYVLDEREV